MKGGNFDHVSVLKHLFIIAHVPSQGLSGLCMSCFVFNYNLLLCCWSIWMQLFRCNYVCYCLWASCSLPCCVMVYPSLSEDSWSASHFFHPSGIVVPLIYSPYQLSLRYFCIICIAFLNMPCNYESFDISYKN